MNKYLLMSAAAVLAGTSATATAVEAKTSTGTQAFYLTGVTSHGATANFCDVFQMHWQGGIYANVIADQESVANGCQSSAIGIGAGLTGKDKVYKWVASDADSIAANIYGPYVQITFGFEMTKKGAPLDDGTWGEIVTMLTTGGSINAYEAAHGNYHFIAAGKHVPGHQPSVVDKLKSIGTHAPLISGPTTTK